MNSKEKKLRNEMVKDGMRPKDAYDKVKALKLKGYRKPKELK